MTLKEIIKEVNDLSYDDFPATIAGYTINVEQDTYPDNPRDWGSSLKMVCAHHRYNLGDEQWHPQRRGEYAMFEYFHTMSGLFQSKPYHEDLTEDELQSIKNWVDRNILWLPLYLYDHSGISISTGSFIGRAHHAEWDSGMVGFIYVTRKEARKEWNWKRFTKSREEQVYKWMQGEVETYDQYLRGEVYWYNLEFGGEHLDSCGGIYDNYNYTYTKQDYIIPAIKADFEKRQQCRWNQIKTWIRCSVPLHIRQREFLTNPQHQIL